MEVRFYGASDDLLEIDGAYRDEIGCYDTGAVAFLQSPSGDRMAVYALYDGPYGVWVVAPTQADEDTPFPSWPMRFEQHENGYSLVLVIDAPDGTKVTYESEDDERKVMKELRRA